MTKIYEKQYTFFPEDEMGCAKDKIELTVLYAYDPGYKATGLPYVCGGANGEHESIEIISILPDIPMNDSELEELAEFLVIDHNN